jgi:hypothetical protein
MSTGIDTGIESTPLRTNREFAIHLQVNNYTITFSQRKTAFLVSCKFS